MNLLCNLYTKTRNGYLQAISANKVLLKEKVINDSSKRPFSLLYNIQIFAILFSSNNVLSHT